MVAPAFVIAQIGYGLIRQILVGQTRKSAAARISQELGVNKATGKKIADQFYTVQKKGKTTTNIGKGKNAQTATSDGTKIQIATTESNAAKMGGFVNTPKGQQYYKESLNFGKRATTPIQAGVPGRGFMGSMADMGRAGTGFLTSPAGVGTLGAGLLGYGILRPPYQPDQNVGLNQAPTRVVVGGQTEPTFSDEIKKGNIQLGITEKSYKDFKTQLNQYRIESGTSPSDLGERFDNPLGFDDNDPRANPEFAEEAELFKLEQDQKGIDIAEKGETVNFRYNPANAGKFDIAYNAMLEAEKEFTKAKEPEFGLDEALTQIQATSGLSEEQPEPRFGERSGPNQFDLVRGDDRNFLERTFGIGDEGVYVRKVYDDATGTYITPEKFITTQNNAGQSVLVPNPKYEEVLERDLVAGEATTRQAVNTLDGPNFADITETTVQPDTTTTFTGAGGQTLIGDQTGAGGQSPANMNTAQLFGLANYLGQLSQNRNTFMGQTPVFNSGFFGFDNRTPMQQFYGQRRPGLFDSEFYKQMGFF
jgi:hypothetical protein|tara:strand:+ start:995 stop:2593 length:1599 start_codon:yes stop_codon:yes gene_type:complete